MICETTIPWAGVGVLLPSRLALGRLRLRLCSLCALAMLWPLFVMAQVPPVKVGDSLVQPAVPPFEIRLNAPESVRQVLQKHLELERFRALPDLTGSELSRLIQEAPKNIKELVATLGYFSPVIQVDILPASDPLARPTVKLEVDPGEPTRVALLEIVMTQGSDTSVKSEMRRKEIEDQWSLVEGAQFTQTDWTEAKDKALRQLVSHRFPAGRIASSEVDIDTERHTAHLKLSLETGAIYRYGALVIAGTSRYSKELVTNLAQLPTGSEYDQSALVQAQQRLLDSGYFDSAQVTLDLKGNPQEAPIRIHVVEAPLQKMVLGIGASTDSGARLSATHSYHQLPGIRWRAVSKLSIDRDIQSIGSEFTSQPDTDHWQWAGSAQFQTQRVGSFDVASQRLRSGRAQTGVVSDQNYYLQYDRARAATSDLLQSDVAESLSFNYAYTLRHFDSVPFPSSGWGLGLEVGGGSTFGASQDPYGRVMARAQAYVPYGVARAGRLALRAQMGAVLAAQDAGIPSTQLFVTGGDTSVRGFGRGEIGLDLPGTLVTAGRYLAVGSAEWQRPWVDKGVVTEWESAVFVDAGAVANTPHELQPRFGLGAGVRWKSPVGPLQIDLAYGAPRGHLHLHMNLGFTF